MNPHRQPKAHEHKRDLIHVIPEGAGPAKADALLKPRTQRVGDAVDERVHEHVAAGEARLCEVRDDHAADGEGVYEAGVEDEGDEVVVQDLGLQV